MINQQIALMLMAVTAVVFVVMPFFAFGGK